MRILDRYIGFAVFWSVLAVLGIIVALATLFAFVDEVGDFSDTYGPFNALWFIICTIPRRAYEVLPMAALVGSLVGLGALAGRSELTVMRAAGVSLRQIVWAVMKPILVVMVAGILVGEYVAPATEVRAQAYRALALGGGEAQTSKYGLWHRQGREFIHINAVQPGGLLLGVTRYRFGEDDVLQMSSFARKAEYQNNQWILSDIVKTVLHDKSTEVLRSPADRWDVALTPELLNTVIAEPSRLSASELWQYIHYLGDQELNNSRYWLAFWTKLLQPLVTASLVLLAISFIFGPLRTVTMGQRIFTGVVVGFVFSIGQELLGPSSLVFNFPPLLAVLIPIAISFGVGFWLLRRAG